MAVVFWKATATEMEGSTRLKRKYNIITYISFKKKRRLKIGT